MKQCNRNRGFTLVELLVALALGILLSVGIVNIYLENRRNYLQDEELARLQENARYALRLLKRELTMAGFIANLPDYSAVVTDTVDGGGCVAGNDWTLDLQGDMVELINNYDTDAAGTFTSSSGTEWTCLVAADLQDGADIVSVKRTADRPTLQNGSLTTGAEEKDGQWYLRTFDENSSLGWTYVGSGGNFGGDKSPGSKVDYWQYFSRIYFLRNYSRSAGDNIPTLCTHSLVNDAMATECLVEGIEDLQIEVGVDIDEDSVPDFFTATPTAAEIEEAAVARIYLLVRSVNELSNYTNNKSYTLGSKTVGSKNDGYIRRVFSTTVQMRNAKLPNA
ncbi:PilW family protein [Gilvimarinus sp. F26214L]|uniref:PilW family protein n=1 Tax=Gilvimarinus sp. DZF01 TaxID=3461371 RepID=UPI004045FCC8